MCRRNPPINIDWGEVLVWTIIVAAVVILLW